MPWIVAVWTSVFDALRVAGNSRLNCSEPMIPDIRPWSGISFEQGGELLTITEERETTSTDSDDGDEQRLRVHTGILDWAGTRCGELERSLIALVDYKRHGEELYVGGRYAVQWCSWWLLGQVDEKCKMTDQQPPNLASYKQHGLTFPYPSQSLLSPHAPHLRVTGLPHAGGRPIPGCILPGIAHDIRIKLRWQ